MRDIGADLLICSGTLPLLFLCWHWLFMLLVPLLLYKISALETLTFPGDTGLFLTPGSTVSAGHWQLKASPALCSLSPCATVGRMEREDVVPCLLTDSWPDSSRSGGLEEARGNVSTLPIPALSACWLAREWGGSVASAFLFLHLFSQLCTEEWESASLGTLLGGLARL